MMEIERPGNPGPRFDRSDSVSSIDRELDWLIGSEDEGKDGTFQNGTPNQEMKPYDRTETRREEPPSSYPLDEDDGEQQHETAVHDDQEEHRTTEEDPLTEEQRLLEIEFQNLKEEGFLPMDDPPEYDIADRVRELNEQLRAEGEIPERTDRKVTFSEKVTAVEFPEELYVNDEIEPGSNAANETDVSAPHHEGDSSNTERTQSAEVTDPNDLEVAKLTLQAEGEDAEIESKQMMQSNENKQTGSTQSSRGQDEKILIERDGKFELISVMDLSPIERRSMGLDVSPIQDETDQHTPITPNGHGDAPIQNPAPQEAEPTLQPRPPSKPRPSTATDSTGLRRSQLSPRRIQSARTQRDSSGSHQGAWSVTCTGYSKYGLTPEQKENKREQMRLRMQQQQEQRQAEEEKQRKKQEDAESAFQGWLQHKKEAEREKRRSEKEQKNDGEKKDTNSTDDHFHSWLQMKQEQTKRERKLRKQAKEEMVNGYFVRDRRDCDQAFKQWVKSKNKQLQKVRLLKRSNATVSRQLAQQSRKSKNLSKALETAQIYRYTDWYGYRF